MLALILLCCFGISALFAATAIVATWLNHAEDWSALATRMQGGSTPAGLRLAGGAGLAGPRHPALPSGFRAQGHRVRPAPAGRAAA